MHRIEVKSQHGRYPILIARDVLGRIDEILEAEQLPSPAALVSNTTIGPLYASRITGLLGLESWYELPDGEAFKRWNQVECICREWLMQGLHRSDCVAALGGGVVTDLVGFAAAVYLRGFSWVAFPTTLLGMVDAAIGGKTGFNLAEGKNLIGSFWPPCAVIADVGVLATLPVRELRAGLAEVIKSAWIDDQGLLELLDCPTDRFEEQSYEKWSEIVYRTALVKASVVAADEHERGARQSLNFGHTLGHALESLTKYERFLHGEAVAWGIRAAAMLARRRGLISDPSMCRIENSLKNVEPLPLVSDLDTDQLVEHIARDKKRDDLGVGWVLPTDNGVTLGERFDVAELTSVIDELKTGSCDRG
ncbi:MAG: 3-dehydroquinate synthase [bacterium]|nr:3-dehydroquinate synthase [bacterium]